MRRVVIACAEALRTMGVEHAAPPGAALHERELLAQEV
jgi:2-aminoethylphosphonate-pyruvate transaminase